MTLQVGGTAGWTAANIGGNTAAGSLLLANSGGFAVGSALGIDTTPAGTNNFNYPNAIAGNMGLTILGPNQFTLSGLDTYIGPTTVTGGTLLLNNAKALQDSTLVTTIAGSVMFSHLS